MLPKPKEPCAHCTQHPATPKTQLLHQAQQCSTRLHHRYNCVTKRCFECNAKVIQARPDAAQQPLQASLNLTATVIALRGGADLNFFGTLRSAADIAVRHRDEIWEAVTAGLIHEVPGKDGGVILVQPVVDGVAAVHHGVDVVLEELLDAFVCKEDIMALNAGPLNVLQASETMVDSRDGTA